MQNSGPSAPKTLSEENQGPSAPSVWLSRRCGDREAHADHATEVQEKIEILGRNNYRNGHGWNLSSSGRRVASPWKQTSMKAQWNMLLMQKCCRTLDGVIRIDLAIPTLGSIATRSSGRTNQRPNLMLCPSGCVYLFLGTFLVLQLTEDPMMLFWFVLCRSEVRSHPSKTNTAEC